MFLVRNGLELNFLTYASCFFVSGDIKGIEGEGMPHYRNPFERGNLYIKFDVTFPDSHFANEIKLKVNFLCYFLPLALKYFLTTIF
jgi:DnaJ-class molecular chaperone